MEDNTVKISHILFMILMMGIIIVVGTYAWLSYRTNHTAMVLTIGEINNVQVTLSPYQFKGSLLPQVTYTGGDYTSVTAVNNSSLERNIRLYYRINSIDTELISSDFKYTIERSTDGTNYSEYKSGNFSSASNGAELTILEESIPGNNTTYQYKVYLWIDGSNSGQSYMQGKSFNGELRATIAENQYQVTFDYNDGTTGISNKMVIYGQNYGNLPTTTRTGYTFKGWSLLPDEYQQVEYIESSGSQYILTDIVPDDETGVYMKVSSNNVSSDLLYFGSKGTDNSRFWIGNTQNQVYFGWNAIPNRVNTTKDTINTIEMNYLNSRNNKFNNEIVTNNLGTLSSANTYPIAIFGGNSSGSVSYKSKIKLYEMILTKGETKIAHFIPCYKTNKNDDTIIIGLYDIVNNRFYSNDGDDDFQKGSNVYVTDTTQVTTNKEHTLTATWEIKTITINFNANNGTVNPTSKTVKWGQPYGDLPTPTKNGYSFEGWGILPNGYEQVEYIKSNGNQYIVTQITPNNETGVYARISSQDISSDLLYFGTRPATNSRFWVGNNNNNMYQGWNTNTYTSYEITTDVINEIKFNYLNNRILETDIATIRTNIPALNSQSYPIAIFAGNDSGIFNFKSKIKLYEFKVSQGNEIIADFIPCYDSTNNKYGLYEIKNGSFYNNANNNTDFEHGVTVYINSSTSLKYNEEHTLYAIWRSN